MNENCNESLNDARFVTSDLKNSTLGLDSGFSTFADRSANSSNSAPGQRHTSVFSSIAGSALNVG